MVQAAVHLPPLPLEGVHCPLWGTCVDQNGGWLQEALGDTRRPLELWRRMTWILKLEVRLYCVNDLIVAYLIWSKC